MSDYLYYPGCSMEGSGRSYRESLAAVCAPLGITLHEIDDWNCCGATEYVSLATLPAYAMITRNLALAAGQKQGDQALVAACSACYLNLAKADRYLDEQPLLAGQVNDALAAGDLHYQPGSIRVRHLLEVLLTDVGLDKIRAAVKTPLTGLKVAPYLGCLIARPDLNHVYNHDQPADLDRLLAALGCEVVDYPLKTECCGGHLTQIAPKVGLELIRRLVAEATNRQAAMMVTICPMCQINIDAYQGEMNAMFGTHYAMPIVFFTQLLGLAFGLDARDLGIGREYTNAKALLAQTVKDAPAKTLAAAEPPPRNRPDKRALPMPRMPESGVH